LIYLLDTNVLADFLNQKLPLTKLTQIIQQGNRVCICRPVHYETMRGLTKVPSPRKLQVFNSQLLPMLEWVELRNADWEQATQYWAATTGSGKQLNDMDLLIGAIAVRLGAIVVTADDDFNALPIRRENWRTP